MKTRLLFTPELENLVKKLERGSEKDTLLLCTIMEFLEFADMARNADNELNWNDFERNWQAIRKMASVVIVSLDQECLQHSLFEISDENQVTDLWKKLGGQEISPNQTVRRLILRPSEQTWWDNDIYEAMEQWHIGT